MKSNTSGYSILIALFVIGFLLILTSGVYNLVLSELKDNRGRANYLKAQYAAEGGIELALLKIKNIGYGVSDTIENTINPRSVLLSGTPLDMSKMNTNKDPLLSYSIDTKKNTYSGNLDSGEHTIIPLFFYDTNGKQFDVTEIGLSQTSGDAIAWNIVGNQFGLSGQGNFTPSTQASYKSVVNGELKYEQKNVTSFLSSSKNNYLILFNPGTSRTSFSLVGKNNEGFSEPIGHIYASGKIGSYKQNISVQLDNTAYLNMLKYSLFSQ